MKNKCLKPNQKLGYFELLDLVNDFMDESGIRDFCKNTCEGICCSHGHNKCYNTEYSCSNNEGDNKRLPCSIWICFMFWAKLPKSVVPILNKINTISAYVEGRINGNRSVFFRPIPKTEIESFSIYNNQKYLSKTFNNKNIKLIKDAIDEHLIDIKRGDVGYGTEKYSHVFRGGLVKRDNINLRHPEN